MPPSPPPPMPSLEKTITEYPSAMNKSPNVLQRTTPAHAGCSADCARATKEKPTMIKKCFFEVRVLLAMSAAGILSAGYAAEPKPYLLKPEGQQFTLLKNWTFGNKRPDATVRDKAELD